MSDTQQLNFRKFGLFALMACFGFFLLYCLYHPLLLPIGLSLFFSYILAPLVLNLEKYARRDIIVGSMMLVFLVLGGLFFFLAIPRLIKEITSLVVLIPSVADRFIYEWLPLAKDFIIDLKVIDEKQLARLSSKIISIAQITENIPFAMSTLWASFPRLLTMTVDFVLVPFLTFFLLLGWENLKRGIAAYIPLSLRPVLIDIIGKLNATLASVLKGQVLIASIIGILYIISFSALGITGGLFIGFVAGIARLIPYLDILIGAGLCSISIFSHYEGLAPLIGVIIAIGAIQTLDAIFITPKIMGDRAGLHPAVVVVSVLSLGSLWGVMGVLCAIPLVALVRAFGLAMLPYYISSRFYQEENSPDKRSF